jgi:hypothetical protein
MSSRGWTAVDLDGTLARAEDGNRAFGHGYVGPPVPAMLQRVKRWLAEGRDVRILTARVSSANASDLVAESRAAIEAWCLTHVGQVLPITAEKDYAMVELWDDRAVTVVVNTGEPLEEAVHRAAHKAMLREVVKMEAQYGESLAFDHLTNYLAGSL